MSKRSVLPSLVLSLALSLALAPALPATVYLLRVEVPLRIPPQKGPFQSRAQTSKSLDPRFLSDRFALTKEGKKFEKKTSDPFPGERNRVTIYTCPEVLNKTHAGNSRLIIDVGRQRAFLESSGLIALETQASTARTGKYTPRGSFSMTERVRSGKISSIYNVSMPYWMRLGSSEFGVHAGYLPGYPASAGCIRLPLEAAQLVYQKTGRGTTVLITNHYRGPSVPASRLIDPGAKPPSGQVLTPVSGRANASSSRSQPTPTNSGATTSTNTRKTKTSRKKAKASKTHPYAQPDPPTSPYPRDELGQTFRKIRI